MPALVSRGHGRRGRRTINEINMVPFIDVMLVLLIIFMVTAPLIAPSQIKLPSVGKAAAQDAQVLQIIISSSGALSLKAGEQTTSLSLRQVAAQVKAAQAGDAAKPVVISADKSVKYETVVKVMDTLQRAGVQRVGLSVQLAPAEP
ncbi:MAG: biopolymer transporter ExbD [Burkholderiaceae bacterium]